MDMKLFGCCFLNMKPALTLGVVWTGYLFREADQCPTLSCSGQPMVLTCYCGYFVRIELAELELGMYLNNTTTVAS